MIVERLVFQAKYGKGGQLVDLIKHGIREFGKEVPKSRVLADLTGRMYTIVWENEYGSLEEWERVVQKIYEHPSFKGWFAEMEPLVKTGSREFYVVA